MHGGTDEPENLALACYHCNLHKGPNLTGIDPETNRITPLFHPRRESWIDHFSFQSVYLIGLTPTGRATVRREVAASRSSHGADGRTRCLLLLLAEKQFSAVTYSSSPAPEWHDLSPWPIKTIDRP